MSFYDWTTITELATGIGLIGACIGGVLKITFTGTSSSRCEELNLCCNLIKCKRKPFTKEELDSLENKNDEEKQIKPHLQINEPPNI